MELVGASGDEVKLQFSRPRKGFIKASPADISQTGPGSFDTAGLDNLDMDEWVGHSFLIFLDPVR